MNNKRTLAIIATAPLVFVFSSAVIVRARVSSWTHVNPRSYAEDQASSQRVECVENEDKQRQSQQPAISPGGDAAWKESLASQTGNKEDIKTGDIEGLEKSCEAAISFLKENERRARDTLNGNSSDMFLSDTAYLESLINRFTQIVAGLEYGPVLKHAYGNTSQRQKYQVELLAYEATNCVGKYSFANSTVHDGVKSVVMRIFPRTAPLLTQGVGAIASSTLLNVTTFLDSSELEAEDSDRIIRDGSGRFSLDEKGQALYREWARFDRNSATWNLRTIRNLVDETEIVYVLSTPAQLWKYRAVK